MIFYFFVLGSLAISSSVSYDERQDFFLDDFEAKTHKWKTPHSDVFSFSDEIILDEGSELSGTARDAVQSGKLHAAVEACQSRVLSLSQEVQNTDVRIRRLVKHLVRIYDKSIEYHEGVILMKITTEDMNILKSFANGGKFSSRLHSNIYDLLQAMFTVPSKSVLDRILPVWNFFVRPTKTVWDFFLYIFQEVRVLLMQILFSADLVTYATMIVPTFTFILSLRRGHSMKSSLVLVAGAAAVISYFVELRTAIEAARAKDLARMVRSKDIPPECDPERSLVWYEWTASYVRYFFRYGDPCEQYFLDQIPDSIEPFEIFWKIVFIPLTVAMSKLGQGLREFLAVFGKDVGFFSGFFLYPLAIIALICVLALILSYLNGGSLTTPLFKIGFSNSFGRQGGRSGDAPTINPVTSTPATASLPSIANHYNFHFNSSQSTQSQVTYPADINISVPSGLTLQLAAASTSKTDHDSTSTTQSPGGPTPAQPPQLTIGGPAGSHPTVSELREEILALPGPTQNNSSVPAAGHLSSTLFSGRAFSGYPESYSRSVDTSNALANHCATQEMGSGDFISRDLKYKMSSSDIIKWRIHRRKLSRIRKRTLK